MLGVPPRATVVTRAWLEPLKTETVLLRLLAVNTSLRRVELGGHRATRRRELGDQRVRGRAVGGNVTIRTGAASGPFVHYVDLVGEGVDGEAHGVRPRGLIGQDGAGRGVDEQDGTRSSRIRTRMSSRGP